MFWCCRWVASRASARNIFAMAGSRARCGSTRLMATGFSKPSAPRATPRNSSAMPPEAKGRTSRYRDSFTRSSRRSALGLGELAQQLPRVDAGAVPVAEDEGEGVVAHGLHLGDAHVRGHL